MYAGTWERFFFFFFFFYNLTVYVMISKKNKLKSRSFIYTSRWGCCSLAANKQALSNEGLSHQNQCIFCIFMCSVSWIPLWTTFFLFSFASFLRTFWIHIWLLIYASSANILIMSATMYYLGANHYYNLYGIWVPDRNFIPKCAPFLTTTTTTTTTKRFNCFIHNVFVASGVGRGRVREGAILPLYNIFLIKKKSGIYIWNFVGTKESPKMTHCTHQHEFAKTILEEVAFSKLSECEMYRSNAFFLVLVFR